MMSESGLIKHWKQIHWPKNEKCKGTLQVQMRTHSEPKKLSLRDLQGSFFIWSIGSLSALMIFIVELLRYYIKNITHYDEPILLLATP